MAKHERPILPFTLHGQRHLIGCALLAAAFLLALALYLQWGRVRDLRAALAEPLPYTLATDHLAVSPDPAWGAHAVLDEGATQAILLRERPEGEGAENCRYRRGFRNAREADLQDFPSVGINPLEVGISARKVRRYEIVVRLVGK